jgi:outer membrane protein assembly factor BamB
VSREEFPANRSRGPDAAATRRRVLAALVATAGGGYVGHRLLRRLDAVFDPWTPAPGTWPLARYDAANTAHNPHARPPREPSRRVLGTVDDGAGVRPLVGRTRLVRVGAGLATAPRDGGAWTTLTGATVRCAGLGPEGRLVAAARRAADLGFGVVTYDGTTEVGRVPVEGRPAWLTVGPDAAYVGCVPETLAAVDGDGGAWRAGGERTALGDGRLYAAGAPDGVVAHAERRGFGRLTSAGPARAFAVAPPPGEECHAPAVADGRLVVGTWDPLRERAGVAAYDATTGESRWGLGPLGRDAATPALAGDRGFTAVTGADGSSGAVVAVDLASGGTVWRDETPWPAFAPAVGGRTLAVLGADERGRGRVRAYDAATGAVHWTRELPTAPARNGVALVGGRVLVGAGGTLYEFA